MCILFFTAIDNFLGIVMFNLKMYYTFQPIFRWYNVRNFNCLIN
jgi:hypothetical protein